MSEERPKKRLVSFADIAARQAAAPSAPKAGEPAGAAMEKRVTYADLAALSKRPEDFAATPRVPETGIPPPGGPVVGVPVTRVPGAAAPETRPGTPVAGAPAPVVVTGIPVVAAPDRSTPVSGIPETGIPGVDMLRPPARNPGPQIRYALRARDGHSPGEHAVYQALWAAASPHAENSRAVTLGYRVLSRMCGLTVNNCKANLRGLAAKLAIEAAGGHSYTQATTYVVYSEAAILQRRRAAGLTHYIKSRGVVFVDPETGVGIGAPGPGTPVTGVPD